MCKIPIGSDPRGRTVHLDTYMEFADLYGYAIKGNVRVSGDAIIIYKTKGSPVIYPFIQSVSACIHHMYSI